MLTRLRGMALITLLGLTGCTSRSTGSERGPCFANAACNTGLVCLSDVCVKQTTNDGGNTDGGMDGGNDGGVADLSANADLGAADLLVTGDLTAGPDLQRVDDGGLACPGAVIFHPGSETRKINTSVPFSGRGRDPNCAVISGTSLVWTDSLGESMNTGETFNHTFTTLGVHTVTLTATDSASATYTATVTFTIEN